MITKCPHCNAKFKVREEYKGRKTKCSKCQQPFVIGESITESKGPAPKKETVQDTPKLCARCGRMIGQLESCYPFKGVVACTECYNKLRPMLMAESQASDSKYKGVGGWLLVLCVILTIISPVGNAVLLCLGFVEARSLLERFPGAHALLISESILSIGLTAFSIYAGIGLWTARANAVKVARTYFVVMFCSMLFFWAFLAPSILVNAGVPAEVAVKVEFAPPLYKLGLLVTCWIWRSYLRKSKRVRATYGESLARRQRPELERRASGRGVGEERIRMGERALEKGAYPGH